MTRQHQGYGSYKSYKVKKEDSHLVCSDRRASELVHLKLQAHNSPLTAARTLLVLDGIPQGCHHSQIFRRTVKTFARTFSIRFSNGYSASGYPLKGDISIH